LRRRPAAREEVSVLLFYGYLLARMVAAILPIKISYWIADRVADIWYWLRPARKKNLRNNLSLVADLGGDPEVILKLPRKVMRNFARMVTEFLYLPRINPENLDRYIDVESFRPLVAVLKQGPAILVTAHVGNWELGAAVVAMMGINIKAVVYDHPDPRIARMFRDRRRQKGVGVMSVREAARQMASALEGGCLGIVGDRDYSGQGLEVDFFGLPIRVPYAYAGLALAQRIPVIVGFCLRQQDGKYGLVMEPPILPGQADTPRDLVQTCLRMFQKCVEKYPEQWYFLERVGR
jgi:KDO2-lipid IV(A) lauroyltransferase